MLTNPSLAIKNLLRNSAVSYKEDSFIGRINLKCISMPVKQSILTPRAGLLSFATTVNQDGLHLVLWQPLGHFSLTLPCIVTASATLLQPDSTLYCDSTWDTTLLWLYLVLWQHLGHYFSLTLKQVQQQPAIQQHPLSRSPQCYFYIKYQLTTLAHGGREFNNSTDFFCSCV